MVYKNLIFQNCIFVLDCGFSFRNKKNLQKTIIQEGGTISYILNKAIDFVIAPDDEKGFFDSYRIRKAQDLRIPVLKPAFVFDSVAASSFLDVEQYICGNSERNDKFKKGKIEVIGWRNDQTAIVKKQSFDVTKVVLTKFISGSENCPGFGENFRVVKFVILKRSREIKDVATEITVFTVELHVSELQSDSYRIFAQECSYLADCEEELGRTLSTEYFFNSCDESLVGMQKVVSELLSQKNVKILNYLPLADVGSYKLRRMLDEMGAATGKLHPEVTRLLTHIYRSSLRDSSNLFNVDVSNLTPEQIIKASALLMKLKEAILKKESTKELSKQYCKSLSMRAFEDIASMKLLSKHQDILQMLKDVFILSESANDTNSLMSMKSMTGEEVSAFYKMLKCNVGVVDKNDAEYQTVVDILSSTESSTDPADFNVINIYSVHRDIEDSRFAHSIRPTRMLLHASCLTNFLGILARGLLLPFVVISDHGGERSDVGFLGNGIYFTDSLRKASGFATKNSETGTRFLFINEVAVGNCFDCIERDWSLTEPPRGFDSVRGVARGEDERSVFDANEYVIYKVEQQRLRYIVEFVMKHDDESNVDLEFPGPEKSIIKSPQTNAQKVTLDDVENVSNPIEKEKLGLLPSNASDSRFTVSLQEVHIRARLVDMAAEVVIMQAYANHSQQPVEAKYVFPLDDTAAVCGFEAFINDKHVVGKVKEKEVAHKEYEAAIEAGHGAYLMDQEKADVFTVNVGNLPPGAKVLIKITYVCELSVVAAADGSSDSIVFYVPGNVTPTIEKGTLVGGPVTQTKLSTVAMDSANVSCFSLIASVEMPYDIRQIISSTHKIHVKKTAAKACVRMAKDEVLGHDGFRLSVTMAEIHVPRMWVEELPDDANDCACMLAFYPEFETEPLLDYHAIIMLDMSQSMTSKASENLENDAKKLALMILKNLPPSCKINVIKFGAVYEELFVCEQLLENNKTRTKAEDFVQLCAANYGASEAWRPLESLDSIQKSLKSSRISNVFLISDGHLSEEARLLQISRSLGQSSDRKIVKLTRIFTFSVGSSANRHLLRSISHSSGGAHEHFSRDSKSKWTQKIANQLEKAKQPVLKDIRIVWQQYDESMDEVTDRELFFPKQAPENIKTFFNCSRLVAYGFIPHCTSATLHAKVGNQEICTVVSTSNLSIKQGTILHRLAARAFIRDFEDGVYDISPMKRDELKAYRKPFIIDMSCKHGVMSPYTSFVAVEEREKDESSVSKDAPAIADLVKMVDVDIIPEIAWDRSVLEEEMPLLERVSKMIESAETTSYSNILESQRLFNEAAKLYQSFPLTNLERTEAEFKIHEAKFKLQMEVPLLQMNPREKEFLQSIASDYEKLMWFVNFVNLTGKSNWNAGQSRRLQRQGYYLKTVLEDRRKDFAISKTDAQWMTFEDWLDYVFPTIWHGENVRKIIWKNTKKSFLNTSNSLAWSNVEKQLDDPPRSGSARVQFLSASSFPRPDVKLLSSCFSSKELTTAAAFGEPRAKSILRTSGRKQAMSLSSQSPPYSPTSPGINARNINELFEKASSKEVYKSNQSEEKSVPALRTRSRHRRAPASATLSSEKTNFEKDRDFFEDLVLSDCAGAPGENEQSDATRLIRSTMNSSGSIRTKSSLFSSKAMAPSECLRIKSRKKSMRSVPKDKSVKAETTVQSTLSATQKVTGEVEASTSPPTQEIATGLYGSLKLKIFRAKKLVDCKSPLVCSPSSGQPQSAQHEVGFAFASSGNRSKKSGLPSHPVLDELSRPDFRAADSSGFVTQGFGFDSNSMCYQSALPPPTRAIPGGHIASSISTGTLFGASAPPLPPKSDDHIDLLVNTGGLFGVPPPPPPPPKSGDHIASSINTRTLFGASAPPLPPKSDDHIDLLVNTRGLFGAPPPPPPRPKSGDHIASSINTGTLFGASAPPLPPKSDDHINLLVNTGALFGAPPPPPPPPPKSRDHIAMSLNTGTALRGYSAPPPPPKPGDHIASSLNTGTLSRASAPPLPLESGDHIAFSPLSQVSRSRHVDQSFNTETFDGAPFSFVDQPSSAASLRSNVYVGFTHGELDDTDEVTLGENDGFSTNAEPGVDNAVASSNLKAEVQSLTFRSRKKKAAASVCKDNSVQSSTLIKLRKRREPMQLSDLRVALNMQPDLSDRLSGAIKLAKNTKHDKEKLMADVHSIFERQLSDQSKSRGSLTSDESEDEYDDCNSFYLKSRRLKDASYVCELAMTSSDKSDDSTTTNSTCSKTSSSIVSDRYPRKYGFERLENVFVRDIEKFSEDITWFKNMFQQLLGGCWNDAIEQSLSLIDENQKGFEFLDEILIKAGAKSLGEKMFSVLGTMIIVAIIIEYLKEAQKFVDKHSVLDANELIELKDWLKEKDRRYPALYSRLELGSSWENAAAKVADDFLEKLEAHSMAMDEFFDRMAEKFLFYSARVLGKA